MFHVTTGIELHGRVIKKKKKVEKMGKLFSFNVHISCFLTQIVLVFTYLVQVKMTLFTSGRNNYSVALRDRTCRAPRRGIHLQELYTWQENGLRPRR